MHSQSDIDPLNMTHMIHLRHTHLLLPLAAVPVLMVAASCGSRAGNDSGQTVAAAATVASATNETTALPLSTPKAVDVISSTGIPDTTVALSSMLESIRVLQLDNVPGTDFAGAKPFVSESRIVVAPAVGAPVLFDAEGTLIATLGGSDAAKRRTTSVIIDDSCGRVYTLSEGDDRLRVHDFAGAGAGEIALGGVSGRATAGLVNDSTVVIVDPAFVACTVTMGTADTTVTYVTCADLTRVGSRHAGESLNCSVDSGAVLFQYVGNPVLYSYRPGDDEITIRARLDAGGTDPGLCTITAQPWGYSATAAGVALLYDRDSRRSCRISLSDDLLGGIPVKFETSGDYLVNYYPSREALSESLRAKYSLSDAKSAAVVFPFTGRLKENGAVIVTGRLK